MKVIEELALEPTEGQIGLEIEVEGENLPERLNNQHWRIDRDGSLRGESYEYVTPYPVSLQGIRERLNSLQAAYDKKGSTIHESIRAGVHVHLNVQQLTLKELYTLCTLYFILEDVLVGWCGPNREGNHFCLRSKDAEYILFRLAQSAARKDLSILNTDTLRYCSLNVFSLFKYGSIEFRSMRGTGDLDAIYTWAAMLYDLFESSKTFADPVDIIMSMSGEGERYLLNRALPNYSDLFKDVSDLEWTIRQSCRRVQILANATNWNEIDIPSKNPFGRRKIVNEQPQVRLEVGARPAGRARNYRFQAGQIVFNEAAQAAPPPQAQPAGLDAFIRARDALARDPWAFGAAEARIQNPPPPRDIEVVDDFEPIDFGPEGE